MRVPVYFRVSIMPYIFTDYHPPYLNLYYRSQLDTCIHTWMQKSFLFTTLSSVVSRNSTPVNI